MGAFPFSWKNGNAALSAPSLSIQTTGDGLNADAGFFRPISHALGFTKSINLLLFHVPVRKNVRHAIASIKTSLDRVIPDACFSGKFCNSVGFSFVFYNSIVAFVVSLLGRSRPNTVVRTVRSVVVPTFEHMSLCRLWPHVLKKRSGVVNPSIAYRDAASAISVKKFIFRIVASGFHTRPSIKERVAALPVRLFQASAGFCIPTSKGIKAIWANVSTLAFTNDLSESIPAGREKRFGVSLNDKSSVALANDVKLCRHGQLPLAISWLCRLGVHSTEPLIYFISPKNPNQRCRLSLVGRYLLSKKQGNYCTMSANPLARNFT